MRAEVPRANKECLLCGYISEGQPKADTTQTADFHMTEIDILKRSSFLWCDLRTDYQYFIATSFEAWGGVFYRDGELYPLVAEKTTRLSSWLRVSLYSMVGKMAMTATDAVRVIRGDVWFYNKPQRNDLHPTMKPVDLVVRGIKNSSKTLDIVLDPFGGCGSTLIAA